MTIRLFASLIVAVACASGGLQFRIEALPNSGGAGAITVVDLDGDGRPDLFSAGVRHEWFRNPSWKRNVISITAPPQRGAPEAFGWVNGVRHLAAAEPSGLAVYEQAVRAADPQKSTLPRPVPDAEASWRRIPLSKDASYRALLWTDLDDDGSDELAAASPSGLHVFKRGSDGSWRMSQAGSSGAERLGAGDLNGDGLTDLIASSETGVRILWNETTRPWVRHVIASGFRTQSAAVGDFAGKGRLDVITGDIENDRRILLYAAPEWTPVVLASGIRLIQSAALDVDGDGDLDFIGAQYRPGRIFWLEHPQHPLAEPWPFHVIDEFSSGGVNGVHGLLLADIDRDGKLDLVANSGWTDGNFPNSLAWFRVPAEPRTSKAWERSIFAERDAPGFSHYLGVGDVNGDGRPDLATAAKIGPEGNWFAWWEQGTEARKPWIRHMIARDQEGATNILMADVNGDGRTDFFASRGHGRGVVWYEGPDWKPHEVHPSLAGPHALASGDLDGDGDIDFATCAKDARIAAWFENDGKGHFTIHHIYENQASYEIRLVDLDNDGDLDLLVAGQESQNVVWYENRLASRRR